MLVSEDADTVVKALKTAYNLCKARTYNALLLYLSSLKNIDKIAFGGGQPAIGSTSWTQGLCANWLSFVATPTTISKKTVPRCCFHLQKEV